jgi:hypothetical protein
MKNELFNEEPPPNDDPDRCHITSDGRQCRRRKHPENESCDFINEAAKIVPAGGSFFGHKPVPVPSASIELEHWVAKAVCDGIAAGHDTVWVRAAVGFGGDRDRKAFLFFTIATATAERAQALLQDALPLCTSDLGPGYSTPRSGNEPILSDASPSYRLGTTEVSAEELARAAQVRIAELEEELREANEDRARLQRYKDGHGQ